MCKSFVIKVVFFKCSYCLLYTSDAADDMQCVDLGGRRIIKKRTSLGVGVLPSSSLENVCFFSSRRRHTRCREVSWLGDVYKRQ